MSASLVNVPAMQLASFPMALLAQWMRNAGAASAWTASAAKMAAPGDVQMRWAEKFLDQLDEALEWQSPGTMSWRFHDEENWLRLAPSLVVFD